MSICFYVIIVIEVTPTNVILHSKIFALSEERRIDTIDAPILNAVCILLRMICKKLLPHPFYENKQGRLLLAH